jgi:hypothetical protein
MEIKTFILFAGVGQIGIVVANFLLPGILNYRENLAKVSPIIRQIFIGHAAYIVLVVLGFAAISLLFADELCGGSRLGTFFSGFLAFFWLSRVVVQLCYYDRSIKRQHPIGHIFFTLVFLYLGITYLSAALMGL